jgi:septal ring factor EnvC (AmiA/AmiB activator)
VFRVKRTKGSAVHYAAAVSPAGAVDGLTRDAARAVAIPGEAAERVKAYHARRPAAGDFSFEPTGEADPAPAPKGGTAADVAKLEKKLAAREASLKGCAAELEAQKATTARLTAALDAAVRERDEYRDQVGELTAPPPAAPTA